MIKPIFYYVSHFNVAATGGAKPRFQGLCVYKSRHTYLGQDLVRGPGFVLSHLSSTKIKSMPFAELAFNLAIYSLAIITALLVGSFIGAIILRLTTQILNYGLPAYWNTFKTVLLTNIVLTVFNYIMTANTLAPVFLREFLRPENTNRRNQGFIDQENYRMISQLTYQFTPTSTLLTLITITLMIAAIFN